jgi:hypothetical protein
LAKTKADGLLGSLVAVRAVEADNPGGDMAFFGLDAPSRTATMVLDGGAEITIEFGNTREAAGELQEGVWMKVAGKPGIWIVTDYTIKNIFKATEDLLPDQE